MKINIKRSPQNLFSIKILSTVGVAFLLYLIINLIYLKFTSYQDVKNILSNQNKRILNDLIYKNGKWDTSFYVNDNQISQTNPLYIITLDGFVIDRENPIKGFLDSSDFKYSSSFQEPQTITTPAGETWRIYSKNINNKNGDSLGTIITGRYQPEFSSLAEIDNQLKNAANTIESGIKVNAGALNTNNVDVKNISIFISFEIVDKFNHVLIGTGGIPAYIDRSYLSEVFDKKYLTVNDRNNGEQYLIYSLPFIASEKTVGIVVSGYPLKQVNKDLQNQLIFSVGSGIMVIILLIIFLTYLLEREIASLLTKAKETVQKIFYVSHRGGAFGFDQDTGLVYLDDKKMEVPVKTKQYYICKTLFSKPKKNWENDEIMDHLPVALLESEALDMYESQNEGQDLRKKARSIYDAIRLLNEKARMIFNYDVILVQGKTYRINPDIQPQKA